MRSPFIKTAMKRGILLFAVGLHSSYILRKPLTIFILLALFLCLSAESSHAQSVTYGYDSAGNRISRTIVISTLRSAEQEQQEETSFHSEVLNDLEIRIYPNPTYGLLKVEIRNMKEEQSAALSLYDLSGKLILSRNKIVNSTELDISSSASGTYILRIFAGESKTEWKIIKK
jgi:YD repeat-containing protein